MNLSKKDRDGMRQALSVLDGFTFTEDEDEFMAGAGLSRICVDLGRCLDDLGEKVKQIEKLEVQVLEERKIRGNLVGLSESRNKELKALEEKADRLERRLINAGHVSDARMLELAEKHEETGVKLCQQKK